jgi:CHASE2 domain-containing sensor protein
MHAKKAAFLLLGTLCLAALMLARPLRFVENVFYDLNFAFAQTARTCDSVVIVGIDAQSISGVGGWPWPRTTIAHLIERIASCSPAVVAVDVLFPPRPEDTQGNDSLRRAFAKIKKLVLPVRAGAITLENTGRPPIIPSDVFRQRFLLIRNKALLDNMTFFSAGRIDGSDTAFTRGAVQSGVINVTTGKMDQKLREIVQVIKVGDEYFPSFALCAVSAYLGLRPDEFVLDGAPLVRLGNISVPISTYAGSTLLHYRGRQGTVRTVSAMEVISGSADAALLRDKLVFVGVTDPGAGVDFFPTPVGTQYPGVELWATSAMDVLQQSWIRDTGGIGAWFNFGLAFLLFPGLAILVPSQRKGIALAAGACIVATSIGTGFFLFGHFHYFWNPGFHAYAWLFSVLYLAAQKGAPSLLEAASFTIEVPPGSDMDMLPPPVEKDFLSGLPEADTASYIAQERFGADEKGAQERLFGATVEELPSGALPSDKRALAPDDGADLLGELAGGRIVQFLGSGGMADVYLVWNPRLEVYRAVKVIKPGQPSNLLARFETEIRILSKLQHPHIVQFFNVGQWHSLPYIEMEYVPGASLEKVLKKCGVLTPQQTAAVGVCVCRALDYAHKKNTTIYGKTYKGVIHRDLKPANIMCSKSGRVKLTDFGIARPQSVSLHTMDSGAVVGTLPYLAPEQMSGTEMDCRVDVYALGATLYELLSGERAFPQTDVPALLSAKSSGAVKQLLSSNGPRQLTGVILKALSVKPGDRFESAWAMERELEKSLAAMKSLSGYPVMAGLVKRYDA